jgi:hypothetical protein
MTSTTAIYAVATTFTRCCGVDDEGGAYWDMDNIADLLEMRGTLDEVTRAIVAAVAPFSRLEWSATRNGHLTANIGGDEWVMVEVFLSLGDDDCPTIAEMDAPALHVAAVLAARRCGDFPIGWLRA